MDVTTETLSPTRVKLSINVPFEELEPSIKDAYKKLGSQVRVPGFRPGKVPARLIDERVGRASVLAEAVEDALPKFYSQAVQDENISVLSRPEVDVTGFGDGEPLAFTAEVDVRPEIELPSYEGLKVSVEDAAVSDADVDERIDTLRGHHATTEDVDRPAAAGDAVRIDIRTAVGGEQVDDGTREDLPHVVGEEGLGEEIDGPLNRALLGAAVGSEHTFDVPIAYGDHAGETGQVTVTLKAVQARTLPEVDDDFATKVSRGRVTDVEALRNDVRTELAQGRRLQQGNEARDKVIDVLLGTVEVPLPEAAVQAEVDALEHQVVHALGHDDDQLAGYLDQVGKTKDSWLEELKEQAEKSVRMQLVLDAIADKEELGVSQEDLMAQVWRRAMSAGMDADSYAQQLVENDAVPALALEVRRGKALALVLEKADITDASGEKVDLEALRNGPAPE